MRAYKKSLLKENKSLENICHVDDMTLSDFTNDNFIHHKFGRVLETGNIIESLSHLHSFKSPGELSNSLDGHITQKKMARERLHTKKMSSLSETQKKMASGNIIKISCLEKYIKYITEKKTLIWRQNKVEDLIEQEKYRIEQNVFQKIVEKFLDSKFELLK